MIHAWCVSQAVPLAGSDSAGSDAAVVFQCDDPFWGHPFVDFQGPMNLIYTKCWPCKF